MSIKNSHNTINTRAHQEIASFLRTYPNGIIIIRWATATGKTGVSLELAREGMDGREGGQFEIISADSRQVYRGMDIGTDKVTADVQKEIAHRWLDLVNPDEEFTAGQWKQYTEEKIAEIQSRGHVPLIVWWTGLYIDMLYRNFAMPELAPQRAWRDEMMTKEQEHPGRLYEELSRVDHEEAQKNNEQSLRYILRALEIFTFTGKTKTERSGEQPVKRPILMLWLRRERDETNALIDERIDELFDRGLVNEVEWLIKQWYTADLQSMNGIWYKEIIGFLNGEYSLDHAKELLKQNTHRLAKKQRTRFRKYLHEAEHKPKEQVVRKTMFL